MGSSKSLFASVASGYATVAVQAITGLLLVPFLLSTHGVGLHGFGEIATIQALAAVLTVLLDGHRQYSARRIALTATDQQSSSLTALLVVTATSCVALGATGVLLAPAVIDLIHLRSPDVITAWRLACAAFVFEQLCYLLESHLHSARRSPLANLLGGADAVTRAALVVALFLIVGPSVEFFFLAALTSLALKFAVLLVVGRKAWCALPASHELIGEAKMLMRSTPLALNGIAPFLVFRLTVIVGNKYLGSEQAGVLSLILVTLRTYLQQAIFSAMRPILIARLVGNGWSEQSAVARQSFLSRLRSYQLGVGALAFVIAAATHIWLPIWLGDALTPYAGYFAVLLILFAAEVAYGVPYYWLVANGRAHRLAVVSGIASAFVSAAVLVTAWMHGPMMAYVLAVAAYLAVYIAGVRQEFRRWFGVANELPMGRRVDDAVGINTQS